MTDEFIRMGATGNSSNGYFAGSGAPTPSSSINRVDFSNDTAAASLRANLTEQADSLSGLSSKEDGLPQHRLTISTPFAFGENYTSNPYGYYGGGGNYSTLVDRIDYSSDTSSPTRRGYIVGGGVYYGGVASLNHGYFTGGDVHPNTLISRVERIDFSNDLIHSSVRGPLSQARVYTTATGTKDYGYVGGGNAPSAVSSVDRINYANDTTTASPRGPLSLETYAAGATGNPSYGYWGGGNSKSTISRLDYSNDTAAATAKGPLSAAGRYQMATGNKDYGWWGGASPSPGKSTVDRLDYSNDTTNASTRGPLNTGRYRHGATGNTTQGYFIGGQPSPITTIERIDYSNDTATATFVAPIITNVNNSMTGAFSSQANALPQTLSQGTVGSYGSAYCAGGEAPGTVTTIQRIDYSNDTATASVRGNLTQQRYNYGQSVSSISYGYVMGGYTPSVPEPNGNLSSIERIDYSNDTATTPAVANLSVGSPGVYGGGATGNVNFGYLGGGNKHPGGANSAMQRIDYGSDTVTQVSSFASGTRGFIAATGNKNYGYWGGGYNISLVERLDYSNDSTNAAEKGPLNSGIRLLDATGNNNFGYFIGGQNASSPPANSEVRRLDYSNDTATTLAKGPLMAGKYMFAGTGNSSHGYVSGGAQDPGPTPSSATSRIDYSNDTAISSPKGPLVKANRSVSGMSAREHGLPIIGSTVAEFTNTVTRQYYPTSQRGYFFGGDPGPVSIVDRIDFANDTAAGVRKGNIAETASKGSATGNVNYALFGGSSPAIHLWRLDYSNDNTTMSERGDFPTDRELTAAAGNTDYGYWGGGDPGTKSHVYRVDFANDGVASVEKGPLSSPQRNFSAAGNKDFGWFAGSDSPAGSVVSRIDYSNDTATALARGPLSVVRDGHAGTGNASYGYFAGGYTPSVASSIDRIDYANDTATAVVKGPLSAPTFRLAAAGNIDFGYFGGGEPGPGKITTVSRLDFSSDTTETVEKGPLTHARNYLAGTSGGSNALPQFGG